MSSSFWRFLSAAALPLCLIVLPHLSRSAHADAAALSFNPDEYAAYDVDPPDGQAAAIRFTGKVTNADGTTIAGCEYGQKGFDWIRIVPDTPYFVASLAAEMNGTEFHLSKDAADYFSLVTCTDVKGNQILNDGEGIITGFPALPYFAFASARDGYYVAVHIVLQAGRMTEVVFSNEHLVRRGDVLKAGSTGTSTKQLQTVPTPPPELKWK